MAGNSNYQRTIEIQLVVSPEAKEHLLQELQELTDRLREMLTIPVSFKGAGGNTDWSKIAPPTFSAPSARPVFMGEVTGQAPRSLEETAEMHRRTVETMERQRAETIRASTSTSTSGASSSASSSSSTSQAHRIQDFSVPRNTHIGYMRDFPDYERAMANIAQYVSKPLAELNTDLYGKNLELINEVRKMTSMLLTQVEKAQMGYPVNYDRVNLLTEKIQPLI
ncbi:MAG: hypothetical protein K6T83_15480, partial [Alicyclobacillus sp.]|nr:hypothetical protein [Alicyclobacillus sp.]